MSTVIITILFSVTDNRFLYIIALKPGYGRISDFLIGMKQALNKT